MFFESISLEFVVGKFGDRVWLSVCSLVVREVGK